VNLFIPYFAIFLISPVMASDICNQIFSAEEAATQVTILYDNNLQFPELMAKQKMKVLSEINNQIDSEMVPKRSIHLKVDTTLGNGAVRERARINEVDCLIVVDHRHTASQIKNKQAYDPALAHEYGHVVFYEYVTPRLATHPLTIKMTKLAEAAGEELINAKKNNPLADNEKVAHAKKNENLRRVVLKNSELPNFLNSDAARSYHELFADFIAILHSNDLNAISNYLKVSRGKFVESRSFTSNFEANNWTNMVDSNKELNSAHAFFAPTRSFLGKKLLDKWPLNNSEKQKIIKQIADVIIDELSYINSKRVFIGPYDYPDSVDVDYFYLDPTKLNLRLIKNLKQKLE
jgi:hypothetical protein